MKSCLNFFSTFTIYWGICQVQYLIGKICSNLRWHVLHLQCICLYLSRLRFPSRLSLAEVLRKIYGDRTLKLVRKFEKTDITHKKALLVLQFLKIFEDHNVIPKFLQFKVANSNLRSSSTYRWCQGKLLREEIYNKRLVVSKLDKKSQSLYNVKSNVNLIDFHHVLNISLISNEKELEQIKFRHLSKLENLTRGILYQLLLMIQRK